MNISLRVRLSLNVNVVSFIERLIEDHEIIHTVTTNWAPDSNNILVMSERIAKYDLFNEPAVSTPWISFVRYHFFVSLYLDGFMS